MFRFCLAIWIGSLFSGCMIVQTSVTNPVAGLSTVAVVPFFNLSQERTVDGRRFALAYFAELQKVPGFQVLPVGVTEQVIAEHQLQMEKPDDVLKLARLLDVDVVVVGAVTDYDPYYPPRIGLQVSWYSPEYWEFFPGIPVDSHSPKKSGFFKRKGTPAHPCQHPDCVSEIPQRGRSSRELSEQPPSPSMAQFNRFPGAARTSWSSISGGNDSRPVIRAQNGDPSQVNRLGDATGSPSASFSAISNPPAVPSTTAIGDSSRREAVPRSEFSAHPAQTAQSSLPASQFDPREPLMSYTRIFDGSNADLVAALRDYVELSGDRRSGGWEAYLHRSEDFIRFASYRMILEMLTLHGGETQRRVVFKLRKSR